MNCLQGLFQYCDDLGGILSCRRVAVFHSAVILMLLSVTSSGRLLLFLQGTWTWILSLPRDHLESSLHDFLFFFPTGDEGFSGRSPLISDGMPCSCRIYSYRVKLGDVKVEEIKKVVRNVLRGGYFRLTLSRSDFSKFPTR